MGDTTDFEGRFDLSSKMNHLNIFDTLQEWNDGEEKEDNGVLKIINNIVIKIDDNHRKIECPHCGESFFSDET